MTKNLKKRIYTSLILFSLLFLMSISNFVLGYFLIIIGMVSFLEFSKMNMIILNKKKLKQFLFNLLFIIYIFLLCSGVFIFSSFFHLKIIIFLIIITCVASDTGGYIFGKFFKGRKLTKISPNKTIAGSLGALALSTLCIFLLFFYLTKNLELYILIVGLITSIGCQIGDLFFSFLKRKSFLNDTGNFLPGHGGILDRVDGMLIGIPIGFLTLLIIY
jgi:phosphatidate cytidylyltransferase